MTAAERGIWLDDAASRDDLSTFAERTLRLDDAAVVRLRQRPDGNIVAWVGAGIVAVMSLGMVVMACLGY